MIVFGLEIPITVAFEAKGIKDSMFSHKKATLSFELKKRSSTVGSILRTPEQR